MQVRGLHVQIIRHGRLASHSDPPSPHSLEAARRRELVRRWRTAMDDGLSAESAARAVGVARSTLYRWRLAPEPRSWHPHRVRRRNWSPALIAAITSLRGDYPLWGKGKLTVLLRRDGYRASESTVGRILAHLVARGHVRPAPARRRRRPRAGGCRPYAQRLPKGRRPTRPGELVQLVTLSFAPRHGRAPVKQFNAYDPVAKWTCAQAFRRSTAHNAKRFLDKLETDMPFPIAALQVDGGSEFKADFERECQRRGITLFELPPRSPQLNGHVERNNSAWRYEFYGCWNLDTDRLDDTNRWIDAFAEEFNTFRPHQALDGKTPLQYLQQLTAQRDPPSHMS